MANLSRWPSTKKQSKREHPTDDDRGGRDESELYDSSNTSNTSKSNPDLANKEIREWRMRFYKAFRRAKDNKRWEARRALSGERDGLTESAEPLSAATANNKLNSLQPDDTIPASDDWANFLSNKNRVRHSERRNSPGAITSMPYAMQFNGYNYTNPGIGPQSVTPELPLDYSTSPSTPFASPLNQRMSFPTLPYSTMDTEQQQFNVGEPRADPDRLPPPPNPHSTDASVHLVQVMPPPAPPTYASTNPFRTAAASYPSSLQSVRPIEQLQSLPPMSSYAPALYGQQQRPQLLTEFVPTPFPSTTTTMRIIQAEDCLPTDVDCEMDDAESAFRNNERCNSPHLRDVVLNNIVEGDAEASKRAVQMACERTFGTVYNVVCGTGFFSYIAHTDEYCLTSSRGVNCYVFAPICEGDYAFGPVKKRTRLAVNKKKS